MINHRVIISSEGESYPTFSPTSNFFSRLGNPLPFGETISTISSYPGIYEDPYNLDPYLLSQTASFVQNCAEEQFQSREIINNMTIDEIAILKLYSMPVNPESLSFFAYINKSLRSPDRSETILPFVQVEWHFQPTLVFMSILFFITTSRNLN